MSRAIVDPLSASPRKRLLLGTVRRVPPRSAAANRTVAAASRDVRPVVIRMSNELHEAVKAKAATEDRSMAQFIRHALKHCVSEECKRR